MAPLPLDPAELAALLRAAADLLDQAGAAHLPALPIRQLVTLDQAAALVHRAAKSLYRYRERGMPAAVNKPRRGQSLLYDWAALRPWLEDTFGMLLPERHPAG